MRLTLALLFGLLLSAPTADARFPRSATGSTSGGAFITISCPGTGATSSTLTCSGTYTGLAPSTSGWSYVWNTICTGSGTPTVSGIGGGVITTISVSTPTIACSGTLQVTDNLGSVATSGSVNFSTPGPLSLLAIEDGTTFSSAFYFPGSYTIGGVGTYTGTAPTSMTATLSGCGGGTPATSNLVTATYGTGTYQIQFAMPTAVGTGCTITVTDNLSRTATSPAFKVTSSTQGATINANIHNAPGWIASHTYSTTGTRVLNGAGWTPGSPGHFNPGFALNAYQLTSGSCTSASSGGPSGTGGSISDGSCTWAYKSGVDYITFTGWQLDAPLWVSGKTYTYYEVMTLNDGGVLRSYQLDGSSQNAFCTSTAAPTGTGTGVGGVWGTGQQTTSDTCVWDYLGDVTYSSQIASIPTMTYVNNAAAVLAATGSPTATAHWDRPYNALVWNDAEYVAGSGGERNPIALFNHAASGICLECNVQGAFYYTTVTPATGEGFKASLTTSTPLAGYDATKGVAFRNSNATASFVGATTNNAGPAGLFLWDLAVILDGVQAKSTAGPGVFGFNSDIIQNNIIDGGFNNIGSNNAWCMAVWVDNLAVVVNNLVLSHGCAGIGAKYGNTFILWNTFVNVGGVSNTAALLYNWTWVFQDIAFADNAVSGYAHVAGECSAGGCVHVSPINSRSVGNVTDVAGPDNTGTTWWIDQQTAGSSVTAVPGTTFSISPSAMFISPGSDYRPNTGLSTAGAAFGAFDVNCRPDLTPPCAPGPNPQTRDTPDILGNARPNGSSQYSTGAEQHP